MGRRAIAVLVACCLVPARGQTPDPEATQRALRPLLAAARSAIPPASSCRGAFGPGAGQTVGDLLGSRLAYLDRGRNVVAGHCETGASPQRCSVSILHDAGEDVASASIEFELVGGRLRRASLRCRMTP